jgi:hypothetical protein
MLPFCFHSRYTVHTRGWLDSISILAFLKIFFVGLGFELRTSCLQSSHCIAGATPPAHFALVILEMRSPELLA